MIYVNVVFQELNKSYDFKMDWDTEVFQLTEEVLKMISQTEHLPETTQSSRFIMYSQEHQKVLDPFSTLAENGIVNGDTLLIV